LNPVATHSWNAQELLDEWLTEPAPDMNLQGVCLDSRLVAAGDLYLAVCGATTHGIRFAEAAVAAGASAVAIAPDVLRDYEDKIIALRESATPILVIEQLDQHCAAIASRFYGDPDQHMTLIAVTGTDGKTSVCRFITQALSAVNRRCGYIGTVGWGLGDTLEPISLTTPDAVSIRRMLAVMREQGAELVALEASSHGLAEGRLDSLSIDVAVLTNIGRDHLDYHKSVEAYKAAKARLFAWPSLAGCVINACDELGLQLLSSVTQSRRFAYFPQTPPDAVRATLASQSDAVSIYAERVNTAEEGLEFELREGSVTGVVSTSLLGRFNVDNLLACYASLRACGIAANDAIHALSSVTPVDGRMERFGGESTPSVVVDFSHTPQALTVAIEAARLHCAGRLWVVFGCGGDRDPGKRAPMAVAAEAADCVIVTDDNPRTESSQDIIDQIMTGFNNPSAVTVLGDRAAAIQHAISAARAEDLVLIAGKGHEDYQIIGTTRFPFSDRVQVLSALELYS